MRDLKLTYKCALEGARRKAITVRVLDAVPQTTGVQRIRVHRAEHVFNLHVDMVTRTVYVVYPSLGGSPVERSVRVGVSPQYHR